MVRPRVATFRSELQTSEVEVPARPVVLGDGRRCEPAVRQAQECSALVGLEFDHDRRRPGRHRRGFAFPTPGEDELLLRDDLDESTACHLAARHPDLEDAAGSGVDLTVYALPRDPA